MDAQRAVGVEKALEIGRLTGEVEQLRGEVQRQTELASQYLGEKYRESKAAAELNESQVLEMEVLRSEVAKRTKLSELVHEKMRHCETQLLDKSQQVVALQNLADMLKQRIDTQTDDMGKLHDVAKQRSSMVDTKNREAENLIHEAETLQDIAWAKAQLVARLEEQELAHIEEIARLEAAVEEKSTEVVRIQDVATAEAAKVQSLSSELLSTASDFEKLQAVLPKARNEISVLQRQLDDKDGALIKLQSMLQERSQLCDELYESLARTSAESADHAMKIDNQSRVLEDQQAELAQKSAVLSQLSVESRHTNQSGLVDSAAQTDTTASGLRGAWHQSEEAVARSEALSATQARQMRQIAAELGTVKIERDRLDHEHAAVLGRLGQAEAINEQLVVNIRRTREKWRSAMALVWENSQQQQAGFNGAVCSRLDRLECRVDSVTSRAETALHVFVELQRKLLRCIGHDYIGHNCFR